MDLTKIPRPTKQYHKQTYGRISPSNSTFSGAGKTVFITGGGGGIGLSIGRAFASTGIARLAILARRQEVLNGTKQALEKDFPGLEVLTYAASVTDYARVRDIVKDVGRIDVLVSNAAIMHDPLQTERVPLDEIQNIFAVNVFGPLNLVQAFLELPADGRQRVIIDVSTAAAHLPLPLVAGLNGSKVANTKILKNLADEYKDDDTLVVQSFHPGVIYSEGASTHYGANDMPWEDSEFAVDTLLFALYLLLTCCSKPAWSLRSLARFTGGCVPAGQIHMGTMGRWRAHCAERQV